MKVLLVLVLCSIQLCQSHKILAIIPHPGRSHFATFEPYLKALTKRGHEVTVISHFPQKTPIEGYKDISLVGLTKVLNGIVNISEIPDWRFVKYAGPVLTGFYLQDICQSLGSYQVQDFLSKSETFDLVIAEMFSADCYLGVLEIFKVPLIGLSSLSLLPWVSDRFGIPDNPSYIPSNSLDYSDDMTFLERFENTCMWIWCRLVYCLYLEPRSNSITRVNLGANIPSVNEIARRASLILVNTHFSLNLPRPLSPNVIEVAGVHLEPLKKLPEDIDKFVTESEHGVILVSFGTLVKGDTFTQKQLEVFQKSLSKLPQRILWKWESKEMSNKPDNVKLVEWMPQFDVLCHPKTKAFITHAGLLGTIESAYCGVPMIAMPQFGDQYTNAKAIESVGGGLYLNVRSVSEEELSEALETVLDKRFVEQARNLSARFIDRQMPPIETALYWTEYVIRHNGAPHLKPKSADLPFYKYLLLDVLAFSIVLVVIFYNVLKFLLNLVCPGGKREVSTSNKLKKPKRE